MTKFMISAWNRGTQELLKILFYSFMVSLMLLQNAEAEPFNCHFDRCDTDNDQYCNEEDKRCGYCTCAPQQVIPECRDICAKKMVTTASVATTLSNIPTSSQNPVSGANIYTIVAVTFLLVLALTVAIITLYLFITKKYCFSETVTPSSSSVSSKTSNLSNDDSVEISIENSPLLKEKTKLPTEEQGCARPDDSKQIHTSPTVDDDEERHKRMMDANAISIHKNKCQESDETLLKQTMY